MYEVATLSGTPPGTPPGTPLRQKPSNPSAPKTPTHDEALARNIRAHEDDLPLALKKQTLKALLRDPNHYDALLRGTSDALQLDFFLYAFQPQGSLTLPVKYRNWLEDALLAEARDMSPNNALTVYKRLIKEIKEIGEHQNPS